MSSLKSRLLAPDGYVEKHILFGAEVYLRRLTIAELDAYEQTLKKAQDSGSNTQASIAGASLILQTLCDKAGKPLPTEELPTAEELIATKSTHALIELKPSSLFSSLAVVVWIALKKTNPRVSHKTNLGTPIKHGCAQQ